MEKGVIHLYPWSQGPSSIFHSSSREGSMIFETLFCNILLIHSACLPQHTRTEASTPMLSSVDLWNIKKKRSHQP